VTKKNRAFSNNVSQFHLRLTHHPIKMLKAELAPYETRSHPFPPRYTHHTNAMLCQFPSEHSRFDGVCAEKEVKESILDPSCGLSSIQGTH
jgi:hypothetical protein